MSKAIYQENCFFHLLQPMQYKLKILPWNLFSSSFCSRQQTHSLCVVVIWHRSQEHQNVPSNRSFTTLFSRSLSSGTRYPQEHDLARNSKVEDQPWPRVNKYACQDKKSLGKDDVTLSGLARPGSWAFLSKWRLPMPNFRLLWRQISWDRMHFRSWNFGE